MALFKNDTINIGNIKPQAKIEVFWAFEELKRSDIATYLENGVRVYAIEKNCSCQGETKISDAGIALVYNDKGLEQVIDKSIRVYLDNGNMPVRVKNDRGIEEFNSQLGSLQLKFTGTAK